MLVLLIEVDTAPHRMIYTVYTKFIKISAGFQEILWFTSENSAAVMLVLRTEGF
jgi:hypothetical protein